MDAPSSMLGVDWTSVVKTLGSTTIVVAALGFVASKTIQYVIAINMSTTVLKQQAVVSTRTARDHRIREEIMRWANPILGSVEQLKTRLNNVLYRQGYLALSTDCADRVPVDWSITYDYFLPSTIFIFCQYFCLTRLLEEELSFELFQEHEEKDNFLKYLGEVGHTLSAYPFAAVRDLPGRDRQVFRLQQQAIGEAMIASDGEKARCLRYSEFLERWSEPSLKRILAPIVDFVDDLKPGDARRWKRLELMEQALEKFEKACKHVLQRQDK